MGVTNVGLTAAAAVIATSLVGLYPGQAKAFGGLTLSSQIAVADAVQKVGWRKRRLRRFLRRHWRYHRHHGHFHGHVYGYHPGVFCHAHNYKVRGMIAHKHIRCGHRHYRAYRSWTWK